MSSRNPRRRPEAHGPRRAVEETGGSFVERVMNGHTAEQLDGTFQDLLSHCHGSSYREIAEVHASTPESIGVRLHRARKRAARILEQEGCHETL